MRVVVGKQRQKDNTEMFDKKGPWLEQKTKISELIVYRISGMIHVRLSKSCWGNCFEFSGCNLSLSCKCCLPKIKWIVGYRPIPL